MGVFLCVSHQLDFSVLPLTQAVIFQGGDSGKKNKSLKPIQNLPRILLSEALISLIRKMYGQINDKWSGGRENSVQRNAENKKNMTGKRGRILLGYHSLKIIN